MDGLGAGVKRPLDPYGEITAVRLVRRYIRYVLASAVHDRLTFTVCLCLVPMVLAIDSAVKIILIPPPGDAGHDVDTVMMLPPAFDPRRQRGIDPINNRHISIEIDTRRPGGSRLKA